MKKVAVIGAGISGLTIANLLKDKYIVKVYEKESIPGGLISCKEINGDFFIPVVDMSLILKDKTF